MCMISDKVSRSEWLQDHTKILPYCDHVLAPCDLFVSISKFMATVGTSSSQAKASKGQTRAGNVLAVQVRSSKIYYVHNGKVTWSNGKGTQANG